MFEVPVARNICTHPKELCAHNPAFCRLHWEDICVAAKGTMEHIAGIISGVNNNPNAFMVATHPPTLINQGEMFYYETLIYYRKRRIQ